MEEFVMENREKKSLGEIDKFKDEELGNTRKAEVGEEQEARIDNPSQKETNIPDDKNANLSKIIDEDEIHGETAEGNEIETENVDVDMADKDAKEAEAYLEAEANLEAKNKEMDLLEVPKIEETGTESQASSDVSSTMDLLEVPKVEETDSESQAPTDVSSIEDSAVREKREKEEKVTANYKVYLILIPSFPFKYTCTFLHRCYIRTTLKQLLLNGNFLPHMVIRQSFSV